MEDKFLTTGEEFMTTIQSLIQSGDVEVYVFKLKTREDVSSSVVEDVKPEKTKEQTLKELWNLTYEYSDEEYDSLKNFSKVLTAIAWSQYPHSGWGNFITSVEDLNPYWAKKLKWHGLKYYILTPGEMYGNVGRIVQHIKCDISNWSDHLKIQPSLEEADDWLRFNDLVKKYSDTVLNDLKSYLTDEGVTLNELKSYVLFGVP